MDIYSSFLYFTMSFLPFKVSHFGCKSFALLFDDIDHNMCPADKEVFSSFAHAQVSITNEIYQYLGEPETFLFCPTGNLFSLFFVPALFAHFVCVCATCSLIFLTVKFRVLWNILLPKCPSVPLPPHSRGEAPA